MRDAAAAAVMSDPTLNRWSRRRWVELPIESTSRPPGKALLHADEELATTGLALLHEWRRQRDKWRVPG